MTREQIHEIVESYQAEIMKAASSNDLALYNDLIEQRNDFIAKHE